MTHCNCSVFRVKEWCRRRSSFRLLFAKNIGVTAMSVKSIRRVLLGVVLLPTISLLPLSASAEEVSAVTAIASHNTRDAAFIGYASGVVSYCSRLSGCTVLEGTPSSSVTSMDIPRQGSNARAWVGYANGSVFFCTLTGGCIAQEEGQKWEQKSRGE